MIRETFGIVCLAAGAALLLYLIYDAGRDRGRREARRSQAGRLAALRTEAAKTQLRMRQEALNAVAEMRRRGVKR